MENIVVNRDVVHNLNDKLNLVEGETLPRAFARLHCSALHDIKSRLITSMGAVRHKAVHALQLQQM